MTNLKNIVLTTLTLCSCYIGIAPKSVSAFEQRAGGLLHVFCLRDPMNASQKVAAFTYQINSGDRLVQYFFVVVPRPEIIDSVPRSEFFPGGTTQIINSGFIPIPSGTRSVRVRGSTFTGNSGLLTVGEPEVVATCN